MHLQPHQAPSQQCLEAALGSCQSQITLQDPISKYQAPGGHGSTEAHQKPTMVPMPHQTQVQHTNPHLASDSVWCHCALSKWGLFGFSSLLDIEERIWWVIWKGKEQSRTMLCWGRLSHTTIQQPSSATNTLATQHPNLLLLLMPQALELLPP